MPLTYRDQFNKKYGYPRGTSHPIARIAQLSGYKLAGLNTIYSKGLGAYFSNNASVRPSVRSPSQWAQARVYSAVMGGKAARVDATHLVRARP